MVYIAPRYSPVDKPVSVPSLSAVRLLIPEISARVGCILHCLTVTLRTLLGYGTTKQLESVLYQGARTTLQQVSLALGDCHHEKR